MNELRKKTLNRLAAWTQNITEKGFFKGRMGPCVKYARKQGWITEGGDLSDEGKKAGENRLLKKTLNRLVAWSKQPKGFLKDKDGLCVRHARKKKWITKGGSVSAAGRLAAGIEK